MTTHDFLRARIFAKCGMNPDGKEYSDNKKLNIAELKKTQWCPEFEKLQRNRLIMGAFRYGKLNAPGKPQYDRIASAVKRLQLYKKTGNTEHLVDAANICLVEFVEGDHPLKHFNSVDDGEHTKKVQK